jgi:hypothetical protein
MKEDLVMSQHKYLVLIEYVLGSEDRKKKKSQWLLAYITICAYKVLIRNMYCLREVKNSRVPMAHAYNPSYSGGRNREDCVSKPG